MDAKTEDSKLASAMAQGQAQFDSIKEMVERSELPDGNVVHDEILESPLSVEVRSGWVPVGNWDRAHADLVRPEEYTILLCTGGPACRIIGELDGNNEPSTARLEVQDWFTPWVECRPVAGMHEGRPQYDSEPILLAYARCFWFGE